ncbi:hypothetical protein C2E23DRAFT_739709 [Lenzites betulinus]|nr:hypothetical protein C2E23DRAFT_739709 [Lenzites betulinus]
MAALLTWPVTYYFYPIGSHSALHLTRDLPPEKPACVLLLPCGDPRNILYTIFSEVSSVRPALDFTCCDFDAGVLARDVLLLSMIVDGVPSKVIWDVYIDMHFDDETLAFFTTQCRKLIEHSQTTDAWQASPYYSTLRMGSEFTLDEIHRHWSLYLGAAIATNDQELHAILVNGRAAVRRKHYDSPSTGTTVTSTGRSAGPLFNAAFRLYTQQLRRYWETGVTSNKRPTSSHVNPTFLYCRAGKVFAVHHETDPLAPFHLADLFANKRDTITTDHMVAAARKEFDGWCTSYRMWLSTPRRPVFIRFLLGDVLAIAKALQYHNDNAEAGSISLPPAQWTSQAVQLSVHEYGVSHAPTRFDAIDTSNICDSIGMLNILLATTPLLVPSPSSGVLYTESFLSDNSDPSKQREMIFIADLAIHSLLLGVAPVGALSGFTAQSNTHELLLRMAGLGSDGAASLHHQTLTWKRPWTADIMLGVPPLIDLPPAQLASIIDRVYIFLFQRENPVAYISGETRTNSLATTMRVGHYTRETFVVLLLSIRDRLSLSATLWSNAMTLFLRKLQQRSSASVQHTLDAVSALELNALLCRYHLHPEPGPAETFCAPTGRLSRWTTIPLFVRIYLTIPLSKLTVLRDPRITLSDLPLQCLLTGSGYENVFQSVHAVFGRVRDIGSPNQPEIVIEEDTGHLSSAMAASPLVLSFVVPTPLVVRPADVRKPLTVHAVVKKTCATISVLSPILGQEFSIFSATFEDVRHVHVMPAETNILPPQRSTPPLASPEHPPAIGEQCPVHVELEGREENVVVLTARLLVQDAQAKATFTGGALPTVAQTSSCTMHVILGSQAQHVNYPVPIIGSEQTRKVRLARKSSYIEIVVHAAIPCLGHADGMKLNPFPIVHKRAQQDLSSWSMHRVNLDNLPVVDVKAPTLSSWFNTHMSSQFSQREGKMKRRETAPDTLTLVKDTVHYLMLKTAGLGNSPTQGVFALRDNATNDSDTIFFIRRLRFDLSSHTVVCDAFVLPLFPELMATINPFFTKLMNNVSGITNTRTFDGETRAWKQILPALVERCRTTWTHKPECEYVIKGRIPLSEEIHGGDPLCSCGRGKEVQGMEDIELWRPFAPLVTRIALSPLFALSYVEPVFPSELSAQRTVHPMNEALLMQCQVCAKSGRGLKRCRGCFAVVYCSVACQKTHWPAHRQACGGRGRT